MFILGGDGNDESRLSPLALERILRMALVHPKILDASWSYLPLRVRTVLSSQMQASQSGILFVCETIHVPYRIAS